MREIEERVVSKIRARGDLGESKYGTTLDRHDLSTCEWLQHHQEELLDAVQYTEVVMGKFDIFRKAIALCKEAIVARDGNKALAAIELAEEAINGKK